MRIAIFAVLALPACDDSSTTTTNGSVLPTEANAGALTASCGDVEFESVPADPSTLEPVGSVWDDIDLTEVRMEAEFWDFYDWLIARQTEQELTLFGSPIEPRGGGPQYGSATFDREGDRWRPHAWGQCSIELTAPGFGPALFVLDPAHEPDPAATTIAVLATESACTGGEAPSGRAVASVVATEDETSVSIVVLVEPPTGDRTCPGNPSFPLEVDLGSPLGDRSVFDGGAQPALARPWPPTESSLESSARTE